MKKIRTLKQLITIAMTAIVVFLLLTMVLVFSASRNIIDSHTHDVGSATLNYYRSQLDSTLERAATYCQSVVSSSITAMEQTVDPTERYLQKVELGDTLSSLLNLSDNLYFTMTVSGPEDARTTVIRSRCSSMTHAAAIQERLTALAEENAVVIHSDRWTWLEVDGAYYLTRFFLFGKNYCAVCVDSKVLSMTSDTEDDLYLFCRQDGVNIACNAAVQQALSDLPALPDELVINQRSFTVLSVDSLNCNFSIHCLVSSAASELGTYLMQQGAVVVLFCLAMLACFVILLRYNTRAFSTLNQACTQVSQGDLSTEITRTGRFSEEQQIYDAFNDMIQQIQDLRIDLYEQALHAQHSKMGFLRMQIKSHFFVNCLTVIHSLAMVGNTALIQEFSLCLADYFRYLGSGFSDTVRFQSELEHLHNFVQIQQIRYPNRITYHYEVGDDLAHFELLPMIPQTFVENVFKHAMGATGTINLTIRAHTGTHESRSGMWLEIEDNGPGFTAEQLASLNAPWTGRDVPHGSGTGIQNTRERLHLFYHGRSELQFSNCPDGGALVRVFFPAHQEKGASACIPS